MPTRFAVLPLLAATLATLICLVAVPAARADDPVNTGDGEVAILGYDPVAYFLDGEPRKGDPAFEHRWQGAVWRFASAEHRDRFAADPAAFAPRYGGFCSGGMSRGMRAPVDPEAWTIIDGRLYLAFSKPSIERFVADAEGNIDRADAHWERLRHGDD